MTRALTERPMTPADAGRWAELLAACEEVDATGEHYDVDDCVEELTDPDLDLERDSRIVLDAGRAVAAVVLPLRTGGFRRVIVDGSVHPEHRGQGHGTALLEIARRRAAERDATVAFWVHDHLPDARALAEGAGLAPVRWWFEMRRDLAVPVAPVPLPDGLDVVPLGPPYDADRWDEPLRAAHNTAFADHWGSAPLDAEAWHHHETGSRNFRPEFSVVASTAAGDIAGYVLAFEFTAETERTGVRELHVAAVGTLRAWRGRGVAGALLVHVLASGAAAGYTRSSLRVDADSPTGAGGVYERAGYTIDRRMSTWCGTL